MSTRTVSLPAAAFDATLRVPGDKSLSHRALIFAAFAPGASTVSGLGTGADVRSTVQVLGALGVDIDTTAGAVVSPGIDGWTAPAHPLDCGNSGTTLRLMAGALAGRPFPSTLTGDASLSRRPMRRLQQPLSALGCRVDVTPPDGTPPVTVGDAGRPTAADVSVALASAQVRSAFELAALQADGVSTITGPAGYRDHTERWLAFLGRGQPRGDGVFVIHPGPVPAIDYEVPGDPSSAAFLWALAAINEGASVTTPGLSLNPGRTGFLHILEMFGAEVVATVTGSRLGDPVGDVTVSGRGLTGITVGGSLAVAALDELPLVGVLGAAAVGTTVVGDAAELATKESNRIETTVALIDALGGAAMPRSDGFVVTGGRPLHGGEVAAANDHRIAMCAAVAASAADGEVVIGGGDVAAVSWPDFYDTVERLWS